MARLHAQFVAHTHTHLDTSPSVTRRNLIITSVTNFRFWQFGKRMCAHMYAKTGNTGTGTCRGRAGSGMRSFRRGLAGTNVAQINI